MRILYTFPRLAGLYAILLVFWAQSMQAQTDLCAGAPSFPIVTTCPVAPVTFTINGAWTNSADTPPLSCGGTSYRDGWFVLTTDSSTNAISIATTVTSSTTRFAGFVLYTGSCGSYTEVAGSCAMPASVNAFASFTVTPSTTYYLRMMRTESAGATNISGTICVLKTGSTLNDDCASATTLPVNSGTACTTTVSGTTIGATQTQSGCAGTADDDVWYKFVATATSHTITVTPGTMTNAVFQVFSGTCGGTLTSLACVNATTGASAESSAVAGLTIGSTYFVRVHSFANGSGQGTFTICATTTATGGYCNPTSSNTGAYIANFTANGGLANNINNTTGNSFIYGNYSATQVVNQYASGTINFSITNNNASGASGFAIYVDWNNDLDFADAGETIYSSNTYLYSTSGSFTIPATATLGTHRMRVTCDWLSMNPTACGTFYEGEAEDYTLMVSSLPCASVISGLTISAITATTATYSWTAPASAPGSGYQYYQSTSSTSPTFSTPATGSTAAGIITKNVTGLTPATTYYVWVRTNCGGGNGTGTWTGPVSFTTGMATTGVTICAGGSGNLTATGACTTVSNIGLTIAGSWNAATNPVALQPQILIANSTTCSFDTDTANYTTYNFQVSATGSYTFTMAPNGNYDGMGYIVIPPFTPGVCGSGTWVVGDDDSSGTSLEPSMTATLTAGITYTLVSTVFGFSNITVTDSFQWNITGPAGGTLSGATTGTIQWYTASFGGSPIGTGSPFNPVGVAGSGLANTNTAGTTTFYAACSGNPTVRTATNYVINSGPTSNLSGLGNICANNTTLEITLTGTPPWSLTYNNNIGGPAVNLTGINTSTLSIPVSPASSAIYTITALGDAGCTAGIRTGTANFTAATWLGGTSDWNTASNWSTGAVPTLADCVIVPPAANFATISGAGTGNANGLLVKSAGRVEVSNSRTLTVTNKVTVQVGGIFNLDNGSSLLQTANVANSGNISMKRNALMRLYDYTYWNSPVTQASNFTLGALSPGTPFDKFYSWTPSIAGGNGNWIQETATTIMSPLKGYIARAPLGTPVNVSFLNTMTFTGVPNNGNISVPVSYGGLPGDNDNWNLFGNPYPSAVSVSSFLSNATNSAILDGTLYFWTHNSMPNTLAPDPFYGDFYSNYSPSDYATRTNFAGTAACASCPVPNGFIGAGQSFFIKSLGVPGNAQFDNTMRVALNNMQFFRQTAASAPQSLADEDTDFERHRIWINMTDNATVFNQIVVGYGEGATLSYDHGLDGTRLSVSNLTFYSVIPGQRLGIQARPLPFNLADQVPLGYTTANPGNYEIRLSSFDPMFETIDIYVEDLALGAIHNLKESPYSFATAAGTFDSRFVLRYSATALNTNNPDATTLLTAFIRNGQFNLRSSLEIESVQVYDVTGKRIADYLPTGNGLENVWDFNYANGAYFAKIHFATGATQSVKLLN